MIGLALIAACSVAGVHPRTTQRIIDVESGGDELALAVNGDDGGRLRPKDKAEAVKMARELIAKGKSLDLGLMQINSKNLATFGLTPEGAFDQCKNIKVGTEILKENYDRAEAEIGAGQEALRAAVSAYNSGNFRTGQENGYVEKFYGKRTKSTKPETADIDVLFDYEGEDGGFNSSRAIFQKKESEGDQDGNPRGKGGRSFGAGL